MADRPSISTVSISRHLLAANNRLDFEFEQPPPQILAQIPRYTIGELIGSGGMGIVYKAHDKVFDRQVALKVLRRCHQGCAERRDRFLQEARTTARLQHPGIVAVYDMGISDDDQPYFSMKLVKGRTLDDLITSENTTPLERSRLLDTFARVCQTVAFSHSHHTMHLDLKPSNVMVGAFGEVYVMDWGLSRRLDSTGGHPLVNQPSAILTAETELPATDFSSSKIIGTPSYMAPEQAKGKRIGVRADVFGLGAILCEILTGLPPYEGENFRHVYRRAVRGALGRAFQRLESCDADPALIAISKRCLARQEKDRPANAGIIASEITSFVESSMQRAERDLSRFFEISRDLFCIASLDGYFKRVNSNFSRVLGYSDHELVSKPFIEFIHHDDIPQTIRAMQALIEGHSIAEFCNRYRDASGAFRWFEWTAKSIPEDNIVFAVARVIEQPTEPPAGQPPARLLH
ncbi:protein kinase [Stieleria sp. TO1_6]|uniref:protein kinase domain-containing protein n=1 Tax=Stieleria tagensis TaxID=2956795 RepID=UPI00209B8558|nr:protein kinase [Stieleria tagensis]MCO8125267.1 protein kinase [Stieleria tagensis]